MSPQSPNKNPAFKPNGCSFWPDMDYGGCCDTHDMAYFEGGTAEERKIADIELMRCVAARGRPVVAFIMYCGVRTFGAPLWPTRLRWGRQMRMRDSLTYGRQVKTIARDAISRPTVKHLRRKHHERNKIHAGEK